MPASLSARFVLAYVRRPLSVRLYMPTSGVTDGTMPPTLRAIALDLLGRSTLVTFTIDRNTLYNTAALQVSPAVLGRGYRITSWSPTTLATGVWWWFASATRRIGAGPLTSSGNTASTSFVAESGIPVPRYLYVYENDGIQALTVLARDVYVYENDGIQALTVLARALYIYEQSRDGEVFPWLERLVPTEQVVGGQVAIHGDGLGSVVDIAAEVGNVITADSTSGGNIPANAVERNTGEWLSTGSTGAWIRFTFPTAQVLTAVSLEDAATGDWGAPQFRFSDGGANVAGGSAAPNPVSASEYPVGAARTLYTLPAPRTTTYLEIRVNSGGSGTTRGLREVWIYADRDTAAEDSQTLLRTDLMGIVTWTHRSANLFPANSGQASVAAAVVTVPPTGDSGLVKVVENT